MDPHDIYFVDDDVEVPGERFAPWPNMGDTMEGKPWPQKFAQKRDWSAERWERYRRFYGQRLARVDRAIGDLMAELICSGYANNTWTIFMSDHGDMGASTRCRSRGRTCMRGWCGCR